jgi:hypothetical protein
MLHVSDVSEGMLVSHAQPVYKRHVIEVGIEMHHMDGSVERAHNRVCDGVITTEDDRHSPTRENRGDGTSDVLEGPLDVRWQYLGIANIGNTCFTHLPFEVDAPRVRVEIAWSARREPKGVLTNASRPEA